MTIDERIQHADELLQECLGYLVENRRGMAKICLMEALGHVQAIREVSVAGDTKTVTEKHQPNHLTAPHVVVATTHGWDS
jgi:hypothetical protein